MILYFSGTGNSLYVARTVGRALGETVCHMNDAPADLKQEQRVGLVYPVYTYDAPAAVKTFADTLVLNKNAYVFVIATCGSTCECCRFLIRYAQAINQNIICLSRKIIVP